MSWITLFFLGWLITSPAFSANLPDESQLKKDLQQALDDQTSPNQAAIIEALQSSLNAIAECKASSSKISKYQKAIDDFPVLTRQLRDEKDREPDNPNPLNHNLASSELNQRLLQINSQLMELSDQLKQEQDQAHAISDSLGLLPQQQTEARRALTYVEQQCNALPTPNTPLEQAQATAMQFEQYARRLKVEELDLAQLSANNRQELSRLRAELLRKRHNRVDQELQLLRNQLNSLRQEETKQAIEHTEMLAEQMGELPKSIGTQLQINRELSIAFNQQMQRMEIIASQQRQTASQTLQVRQALTTLREQSQWLYESPALGETLRAQVSRLPELPKSQQLDSDMAQLRVQRLHFEDLMNKLPLHSLGVQDDGSPLTSAQRRILDVQLAIQRNLLNALLTGCDTQILELTKLKVANSQLEETMNEIQEAAHRYLFWVADVSPIGLSYPLNVGQDLRRLVTIDTFSQLTHALGMMLTRQETLIPLFGALLLVGFSLSSRRHYYAFLERSSSRVGKVNQDHLSLTLCNVFWSVLVALPLPVLWAALGYGLRHAWPYPVAIAIGDGVSATVPVLWVFMICAHFARPQGLFIVHFGWPQQQVKRALRYYTLSIGMIVPLIMALISFDNYSEREFAGTLGRLCFCLLCACLSQVTTSLKRAGLPLYFDKHGASDNVVNRSLWNIMICAPIAAATAACLGHLTTAQALLARLETSVAIWFLLLIIYHIIRRWMFIQRRRIAFERTKLRRAEMLAQRARNEEDLSSSQLNDVAAEIDEKVLDLDTISAQSLQLVRSILTLIALLSVILLWSELHSAFGFLENITLWDATSTIQGVDSIQPITLGALLIAILVFIITTQMVRNLPSLLELALLQHLDLTPGTGYAITTLTKYGLMLLGGLIGFSMIGIEWSKLQWLVAALGVGLGFGLQEIFANFISGLIILFEKPIRIGDTVTIRTLTGTITRINTRATTITDWDRKEIIVPNKAFITEQFVNWSLSDTVTRVVLRVPAPTDANIEQVTHILVQAARSCPLVLELPAPEAFLVDLQQGLPLFELRMHAAEMGHRMPLRHQVHVLILEGYRKNGMVLPFPPFHLRMDQIKYDNSRHKNQIKTENGSL
ncbi:miniconductance mechanosensitive channel MscM [Sodalis endosymbiont of Henestaris halophilus]|uniref:miniconductance mechanosensitive channel MscM n=1 Tax=Sodalis endosymbiont of Henestaris halophilus TaxID=1929246 RepID=UPI000BC07022|nr:miniconductance mechanosensitive channel MscM [Sodalis endosymbiont of Henestaris halophilus]SNC58871.1 Miniconductance mechanosensitive channel MscM precursor [Sodalis endosymbiont of Henestaris halophilus]